MISCIIPLKSREKVKLRLSPLLSWEERINLTKFMLEDILETLKSFNLNIFVVTPDNYFEEFLRKYGVKVIKEEREEGVNSAVEKANKICIKEGFKASLVIPSDVPLISKEDINLALEGLEEFIGVIISPSFRLDGTNLLLRSPPNIIPTYYDNDSFFNHLKVSLKKGLKVRVIITRNLCLDIDSPEDLKEFLKVKVNKKSYSYAHQVYKKVLL